MRGSGKENEVEKRPKDNKGNTMYPLAQFYLANLPYLPESLKKFEYITVFMGEDFLNSFLQLLFISNVLIFSLISISITHTPTEPLTTDTLRVLESRGS